jgi:alkylhydroperoxidase/carboxymuconolactone decarboxylase family protein YurZ
MTGKSKAKRRIPAMSHTERQIARGDWNPLWDTLREWDPEFVEGYLAMRSVPFGKGPLPEKTKELILVAINAATTHLYAPGVRRHIQNALKLGATREEILQVIELTTVLGIHACNLAVPILAEELDKASRRVAVPAKSKAPKLKR